MILMTQLIMVLKDEATEM